MATLSLQEEVKLFLIGSIKNFLTIRMTIKVKRREKNE